MIKSGFEFMQKLDNIWSGNYTDEVSDRIQSKIAAISLKDLDYLYNHILDNCKYRLLPNEITTIINSLGLRSGNQYKANPDCSYCRGTFMVVVKDAKQYEYVYRCNKCKSDHLSENFVLFNTKIIDNQNYFLL
jgi:hypothetical protein